MVDTRFSRSVLTSTMFIGVDLTNANFTDSLVGLTTFDDLDLSTIHGLETVMHIGPSTIGIDTLYRSKGQIPDVFLRGCGVPNSMIDYARSLVAAERPIDYYSCFISHSSQDQPLAERLYTDLQARDVRCWYAPKDLKIGDSILDRIDQSIRLHDKLLLILSAASVKSGWVGIEVKTALAREHREGRQILFPIRVDDAVEQLGQGWAAHVWEQRHIGDFRRWKEHDEYQKAFERLLRDLKANQK